MYQVGLIAACGVVILVYALYAFLRKQYCALTILPFASNALSAPFQRYFHVSFWVCSFVLLVVALGIFFLSILQGKYSRPKWSRMPAAFIALASVTLIVILKIGLEFFMDFGDPTAKNDGLNFVRNVLLPAGILICGCRVQGYDRVIRDFMVGNIFICGLWIGFGVAGEYISGGLAAALGGAGRLTLHCQDTINASSLLSATVLALGYVLLTGKKRVRLICGLLIPPVLLVGVLVATRQYMLSSLVCLIALPLTARQTLRLPMVTLAIAAIACLVLLGGLSGTALVDRLGRQEVKEDGRVELWGRAYDLALEHPFLGVGFRKFGGDNLSYNAEGDAVITRGYAHGIPFDMMAEHGILLAAAWVISYLWALVQAVILAMKEKSRGVIFGYIAFIGLPISLMFSGTIWNGIYFHIGLILAIEAYLSASPTVPREYRRRPFVALPRRAGGVRVRV